MEQDWLVYLNGDLVPAKDAKLSVFDRGVQYGDGVFEGLRCYEGRLFRLKEHTDRLYRSAAAIGITMPMSREAFNDAVKLTVRANRFTNAHVKPIVTRGIAWKLGLDPRNTTAPTIAILVRPITGSMFEVERGVKLASVSVRKVPASSIDPRVKSLNYLVNILARTEAIASGADEAIMLDLDGRITEGTGDNIFLVRAGALLTPPVEAALEGITRGTVIELAGRLRVPVHETALTLYDVYTSDEVFVTGSAAGIMPAIEVDGRTVGDGAAGRVTKRLASAYDEEVLRSGEPID